MTELLPYRRASRLVLVCAAILLVFGCGSSAAFTAGGDAAPLESRWELHAMPEGAAHPYAAVLWLLPEEDAYAYARDPGETGLPLELDVTAEPPARVGEVRYPPGVPRPDAFDPSMTVNAIAEPAPILVMLEAPPEGELVLSGMLRGLSCTKAACFPINRAVDVALSLHAASPIEEEAWWPLRDAVAVPQADAAVTQAAPDAPKAPEDATSAEDWRFTPQFVAPALEVGSLAKALLFGVLAGLILNVMPCVLPVVSLKLSSLVAVSSVEEAGRKSSLFREHNVFFALGILVYFALLGAVLATADMAWGELFQSQQLVLLLAALMFGLGLSLFGVYDLPIIDLKGANHTTGSPRAQAFATGLVATLLATPCSGPLLGGVLGWVLQRGPLVVVTVFVAIGLGMSLPYLAMALRPSLVRFFPKPGAWTVHLERVVGFFLMAACIYLLSILSESMATRALVAIWAVGFAAWMWGKWTTLNDCRARLFTVRLAALAVAGAALAWAVFPPTPTTHWREFDAAAFRRDLGETTMALDFTADWCPNCKALEATTLRETNLERWSEVYGVTFIKVDLTHHEPDRMALLDALESKSIPTVAVFPAGDDANRPYVFRDMFGEQAMETVLERIAGEGGL